MTDIPVPSDPGLGGLESGNEQNKQGGAHLLPFHRRWLFHPPPGPVRLRDLATANAPTGVSASGHEPDQVQE